ncbi:putative phage abortive infection protein [Undibacterium sp.]|uniref:putative phage abortive infection protein n=1 Tax=Undibacterium sp. TaxID=1914977 RepID=UPI0025E9E1EA|nr:putative phage abortive infection protein [Undibacterium sp.]
MFRIINRYYRFILEILIFALTFYCVFWIWSYSSEWINRTIPSNVGLESASALRAFFGEKFGAVNALFSGLAFAGIILTLLLQRRDLSETRRATDTEQFNDTFFKLLGLHISITEKLTCSSQSLGRESFKVFNEYLKQSDPEFVIFSALQKLKKEEIRRIMDRQTEDIDPALHPSLEKADIANIQESIKHGISTINNFLDDDLVMHERKIKEVYTKVASQRIDDFSHYFRNLYNIIKFMDESKLISSEEKRQYSRIVRAQLSDVELVAIFYNSLTKIELPGRPEMELGYPKMNKLLAKYDILQNMSPRSVFHPTHLVIFEKNTKV